MRTRRLLAASMLAALPLLVGALQPALHLAEADAAGTTYGAGATYATELQSGPKVLWWAGVGGEGAILGSLGFLWNPGLAVTSAL